MLTDEEWKTGALEGVEDQELAPVGPALGEGVPLLKDDPKLYPITVGLSSWSAQAVGGSGSNADLLALVVTGSLLSVVPLIAAFLLLQRYWQSGLTAGSIKE